MIFFDFHVHIARFNAPEKAIEELQKWGIGFNLIACEPFEWARTLELKKKYAFNATYGIHPEIVETANAGLLKKLEELILCDKNATVGEAGLDKRFKETFSLQEHLFRFQLELAIQEARNIQIHAVRALPEIIKILCEYDLKNTRPILHRFNGDIQMVKKLLPLNPIFSLHRSSFEKKTTRESLKIIPKNLIRFESDACLLEHDAEFVKNELAHLAFLFEHL